MPGHLQPRNAHPQSVSQPEQAAIHPTPQVRHEEAGYVHRRMVDLEIDTAKHSVKKPVKNKT